MIYHVRIVTLAQADMRDIYIYIAETLQNPAAAVRRIALIDKTILSLKNNPDRIPLVRNNYLASKGYRMTIAKNHLVFFIIREDEKIVSIMRVLYGRRDWMRVLKVEHENKDVVANDEALADWLLPEDEDAWQNL